MKQETLDMLLEILKKLGCSEETMNAVKNDPALKVEWGMPEKEEPEVEKEVEISIEKKDSEEPKESSPMEQLLQSMRKSKWL